MCVALIRCVASALCSFSSFLNATDERGIYLCFHFMHVQKTVRERTRGGGCNSDARDGPATPPRGTRSIGSLRLFCASRKKGRAPCLHPQLRGAAHNRRGAGDATGRDATERGVHV